MSDHTKVLINSLINYSNQFATLFREAKNKKAKNENLRECYDKVSNVTTHVLDERQYDQLPTSFPGKIITKIFEKVAVYLQNFIELDPQKASDYEKLLKNTNTLRKKYIQSIEHRSSSTSGLQQQQDASPRSDSTQAESSASNGLQQQQAKFSILETREKNCLFCFCLFPHGEYVKKRELVHLWIGMGLIHDFSEGVTILNYLVKEDIIECTVGKEKTLKGYMMNKQVHSMVVKEMNIGFLEDTSFSIMYQNRQKKQRQQEQPTVSQQQQQLLSQQQLQQQQSQSQQLEQPTMSQKDQEEQEPLSASQKQKQEEQQSPSSQHTALKKTLSKLPSILKHASTTSRQKNQDEINLFGNLVLKKSGDTVPVKRLEQICQEKSDVKALILGNCFFNTESSSIVVEAYALKALTKHIRQVKFLSLQGISGIVELPDTIYKLENLMFLDLRGCPYLEFLPDGIDSLKELTHLDLSECYLLDHIPKGVASLTKLKVLKGFIVNPEDSKMGNENKKYRRNKLSGASFSQLKDLKVLIKLTIRSRRGDFPTEKDLVTLCAMEKLANLRISWVCSYKDDVSIVSALRRFPASLKKLELQATPENTLPRLLKLISEKENSLQKLYIRGGRFWDLGMEMPCLPHVRTIRLRYLQELHVDWDEFREFYPNLTRLEVFECPNIFFVPCDKNGVWELD